MIGPLATIHPGPRWRAQVTLHSTPDTPAVDDEQLELSVVIPCLNEADTLGVCIEKARRAILRCQRGGFPLPVEKYAQWQQIEMTFNPEGMRLR